MTLVARAGLGVAATIVVIAALPLPPAVTTAQEPTADRFEPPRTSWGDPDLQGIWDYRTTTPLERPKEWADTAVVTGEAVEAFIQLVIRDYHRDQDGILGADWSDHLEVGLAEGGRGVVSSRCF